MTFKVGDQVEVQAQTAIPFSGGVVVEKYTIGIVIEVARGNALLKYILKFPNHIGYSKTWAFTEEQVSAVTTPPTYVQWMKVKHGLKKLAES